LTPSLNREQPERAKRMITVEAIEALKLFMIFIPRK
jgi:hypothetical protein